MATTRRDEHAEDLKDFPNKHLDPRNTTENGACLTGHLSGRDSKGRLTAITCNYRWQAYKRAADDDAALYDYPRYKSVCGGKAFMTQSRIGRKKANPDPNDWDVTGQSENFQTSCIVPYWHEAHHIVPHGELRDAIAAVGQGAKAASYRDVIRKGLLEEKYNLNHKMNMIILPLDKKVAVAIDLPRHRHTAAHRSHKAYSDYIKGKLDKIFYTVRKDEAAHAKKPDYNAAKQQIVNVSSIARKQIIAAGGTKSLDEAFPKGTK